MWLCGCATEIAILPVLQVADSSPLLVNAQILSEIGQPQCSINFSLSWRHDKLKRVEHQKRWSEEAIGRKCLQSIEGSFETILYVRGGLTR